MSVILLEYQFSTTLTIPPTGNQIRLNAAHPYTAATRAWVRNLTNDGSDMRALWLAMPVGGGVYLQDKNDSLKFGRFVITAPVTGGSPDYVEVPIAHTDHGDAIPAQAAVCLLQSVVAAPAPEPEPPVVTGPAEFFHVAIADPLIPLTEAREHLHIADPAQDMAITRYTRQAQNSILDYLKHGADPAWTSATLPDPVRSAILLLLAHLYERRGDDPGTADKLWTELGLLLERFRHPAVA